VNPVLTKSFLASAAIPAFLIAKASGDKTVAAATGPEDPLIGALGNLPVAEGGMADIVLVGISEVRLGGTVSFGDPLTADAEAKAVKAEPEEDTVKRIIGYAQADGEDGDVIPYLAAPGVLATPEAGGA